MSEQKKVVSLAELRTRKIDNVKYDYVDAYGTTVRIGSVSSADMLEWVEGNQDPAKKKISGLRLLVKSVTDEEGTRYAKEDYDAVVEDFKNKDAQENGKVLAKVLILNGFPVPKDLQDPKATPQNPEATTQERKND